MFFERRTQSSIKHRRLRYLLLLSLRLALLLLMALAFANPFINRSAASMTGEKLMLLVVDNSFSMRAGTRLDDAQAKRWRCWLPQTPAERAQVVALGSQPQLLTQVTQDAAAVARRREQHSAGRFARKFQRVRALVRSVADSVRTPIDLHLFSDMQKSAMPGSFAEMALPANVTLTLHPVATEAVPNWTVESVNAPGEVAIQRKRRCRQWWPATTLPRPCARFRWW